MRVEFLLAKCRLAADVTRGDEQTSKAAFISLTNLMATELVDDKLGIRVNSCVWDLLLLLLL